jgi:hypothetical protein
MDRWNGDIVCFLFYKGWRHNNKTNTKKKLPMEPKKQTTLESGNTPEQGWL